MDSIDSPMIPSNERKDALCKLRLPESILYYIRNNANPKLQLKLMQTSKYFRFKEFPYFVVKDLVYDDDTWKFCQNNGTYQEIDLESLAKPLWITGRIYSDATESPKLISYLLTKTVVCDIINLDLCDQILTMDEYKMLNSSNKIERLSIYDSHIEYDDGNIVSFDKIIKLFPKLKSIRLYFNDKMASTLTRDMTKKLINLLNPEILKTFEMHKIPESFDFKLFAYFMKANPSIDFWLDFGDEISDEYAKMLQDYIDELIETSSYKNHKIFINFSGQKFESFCLLLDQYYC
uniref:F-box domain-containing protein n=1 Tax=Panagrolaimus sp. ES5 TaxID=591445 RepID=A0AC34GTE7_9BILA